MVWRGRNTAQPVPHGIYTSFSIYSVESAIHSLTFYSHMNSSLHFKIRSPDGGGGAGGELPMSHVAIHRAGKSFRCASREQSSSTKRRKNRARVRIACLTDSSCAAYLRPDVNPSLLRCDRFPTRLHEPKVWRAKTKNVRESGNTPMVRFKSDVVFCVESVSTLFMIDQIWLRVVALNFAAILILYRITIIRI